MGQHDMAGLEHFVDAIVGIVERRVVERLSKALVAAPDGLNGRRRATTTTTTKGGPSSPAVGKQTKAAILLAQLPQSRGGCTSTGRSSDEAKAYGQTTAKTQRRRRPLCG